MSLTPKVKKKLAKRLLPLYIAIFFQGFVLWYSIEKLFMRDIGFTDATIGLMVAAYSAVMLIVETPSGILADRWSRKGVLILASIALAISAIIGGLSDGVAIYIVSSVFWGIFYALYSGTYDSIVYDTVLEETNDSKRFEHFYGKVKIADSGALVLSALAGGALASLLSPRATYFASIPFALLAIFALIKFKEPQLHKAEVSVPIKDHILTTFRAVARNKEIALIISVMVLLTLISETLFEFSQLWLIALATPVVFYGITNAALLLTIGIGGGMVAYIKLQRYRVMTIAISIMLLASLGLVFFRNTVAIVAAQVVFAATLIAINVVFTRMMHDKLNSKIRAGAASAVSTFARTLLIPLALLFGYISNTKNVFASGWILFALAAVASILILREVNKNNHRGLGPNTIQ
ncbi:MAG: MFS transporter [Candidatus Saccharimonadales bacterium]